MKTDEAWLDLRDWLFERVSVLDPNDVLDKMDALEAKHE